MSKLTVTGLGAMVAAGTIAISAASGAAAGEAAVVPAQMEQGEALYLKNCRFCHGTKGTSGKRLASNEKLSDAEYVARTILVGPGYMTPFAEHLSDEEVALIATYVRNSWGNAYGPMDQRAIAPLR